MTDKSEFRIKERTESRFSYLDLYMNERKVGYLEFELDTFDNIAYLQMVKIEKDFRRLGLGSRLVQLFRVTIIGHTHSFDYVIADVYSKASLALIENTFGSGLLLDSFQYELPNETPEGDDWELFHSMKFAL